MRLNFIHIVYNGLKIVEKHKAMHIIIIEKIHGQYGMLFLNIIGNKNPKIIGINMPNINPKFRSSLLLYLFILLYI